MANDHASPPTPFDPAALADGARHSLALEVARLGDGSLLRLPVNVIAGLGAKPCLALVAGIHGDEHDGIHALLELGEEIAPARIKGRLLIVPSANPPAFAICRRRSPLDELDLNRIFPGKAQGSPSERLAHCLYRDVLRHADFVFSMHGWTAYGDVVPYVEINHSEARTARASFRAALAAGFDIIRISTWAPGLMTQVVNEAGIAGMEAEVGGMGMTSAENRNLYKRYCTRLMRHLGMIDGGPEDARPIRHRIVAHFDLFAPVGGAVRLHCRLGSEVESGARLATIHDLHGDCLHEMTAPEAGLVAVTRVSGSTQPGELMFRMFRDVANPFGDQGDASLAAENQAR